MEHITLVLESCEELLDIIGNSPDYFLVDRHMPAPAHRWENANISIKGLVLNNVAVRCMQFDIKTNFEGLTAIIKHSMYSILIYQFDKPVPDTLVIKYLPENAKDHILKQNGLKHIFNMDYEFLTVSSYDEDFLNKIKGHPVYSERVITK